MYRRVNRVHAYIRGRITLFCTDPIRLHYKCTCTCMITQPTEPLVAMNVHNTVEYTSRVDKILNNHNSRESIEILSLGPLKKCAESSDLYDKWGQISSRFICRVFIIEQIKKITWKWSHVFLLHRIIYFWWYPNKIFSRGMDNSTDRVYIYLWLQGFSRYSLTLEDFTDFRRFQEKHSDFKWLHVNSNDSRELKWLQENFKGLQIF